MTNQLYFENTLNVKMQFEKTIIKSKNNIITIKEEEHDIQFVDGILTINNRILYGKFNNKVFQYIYSKLGDNKFINIEQFQEE